MMDDETVLAPARSDPTGLMRALERTTIDEVQRVLAGDHHRLTS